MPDINNELTDNDRGFTCAPMSKRIFPYTGDEPIHHMTILQQVSAGVMNGILSGSMKDGRKLPHIDDVVKYAWDYAEAWMAEGKRREWI